MRLRLEGLVQFDHGRVSHHSQQRDLVLDLAHAVFVLQELLVYRLYRHQLPAQLLQCQVHLPKCASAQQPPNLVERQVGRRRHFVPLEGHLDHLLDSPHLLCARTLPLDLLLVLRQLLQLLLDVLHVIYLPLLCVPYLLHKLHIRCLLPYLLLYLTQLGRCLLVLEFAAVGGRQHLSVVVHLL